MRQIQKFPALTVKSKQVSFFAGLVFLFSASIMGSGCGLFVKKTKIEVPQAILQTRSASLEELLRIVNRNDLIPTLQANKFEARYISEKKENGLIELAKYPRVPGYVLLKRPDSIFLVLRDPLVGNRAYSILSVGDDFSVWDHGKRTFYIGKNSAKELISNDLKENQKISIRATHIFEAIFPKSVQHQDAQIRYSMVENDVREKGVVVAKYYIIEVYRSTATSLLQPLRKFWVERSGLTISRQQVYNEEGGIVSDITYSNTIKIEEFTLPLIIHIERPLDGYSLEMEFKKDDWQLNPVFTDDTFKLQPASGVQVIQFQ
jgi:hypothetical protein